MNYIIIDGSYFVICRYFALLSWAKRAEKFPPNFIPHENAEFIQKFVDLSIKKIQELPKKLGIKKDQPVTKLMVKDCPRKDIWRMDIYHQYKSTRETNQKFSSETFFPLVYNKEFVEKANLKYVLQHPHLEGDDCAAIATKFICESNKDAKVWLITNDMDYLQLANDRVSVVNLQFKDLTKTAKSHDNNKMDLFCKIAAGDKSDNIPPIFNGCGGKTAIKYFENPDDFKKKLASDKNIKNNYDRNKKLVDFNEIPVTLKAEFMDSYGFFSTDVV